MPKEWNRFLDGAEGYDRRIRTVFPCYDVMRTAINAILRATLSNQAELLIVGAGTGEEILHLAESNPDWRFTAVEPSSPMLDVARSKIKASGLSHRVRFHRGHVATLEADTRYDAATLALVMHFIPDDSSKLSLLESIAMRLRAGAPLVLLDVCGDLSSARAELLLAGWKQHQHLEGLSWAEVEQRSRKRMADYEIVTPDRVQELLVEAGFGRIEHFFQVFMLSGWIASKKQGT
jgi:tRNA (cmo5U34)-methyltransferase